MISTWTNIPNRVKTGRPCILSNKFLIKLDDFLSQNCISFTLPGHDNQMYVGKDVQGESQFKPKMYILWTFSELVSIIAD